MKKLFLVLLPVLGISFAELQADNFGAGLGVGMVTGGIGGLIAGKASGSGSRSLRRENDDLRSEIHHLERENEILRDRIDALEGMIGKMRTQGQQ